MTTTDIIRAMRNAQFEGDTDVFPNTKTSVYFLENSYEDVQKIKHMENDLLILSAPKFKAKYAIRTLHAQAYKTSGKLRDVARLDPWLNICYLGLAINVAQDTEHLRIPIESKRVHSYRFLYRDDYGRLFDPEINYFSYSDAVKTALKDSTTVISTDLKDFYSSISIEVLAESLKQMGVDNLLIQKITNLLRILEIPGLPVGGNASRILAEMLLHRIDTFLQQKKVDFYRFVDDFTVILCSDEDDRAFLSDFDNFLKKLGLRINKNKTLVCGGFSAYAPIPALRRKNSDYHAFDYNFEIIHGKKVIQRMKNLQKFKELINRHVLNLSLLCNCNEVEVYNAVKAICDRWQFFPVQFPKIAKWLLEQEHLTSATRQIISEEAFLLFFNSYSVPKSSINQLFMLELMFLNGNTDWKISCFKKLSELPLPKSVNQSINECKSLKTYNFITTDL